MGAISDIEPIEQEMSAAELLTMTTPCLPKLGNLDQQSCLPETKRCAPRLLPWYAAHYLAAPVKRQKTLRTHALLD